MGFGRWAFLAAFAVLAPGGCGGDSAYVAEIDAWHAARVDRLRGEDGWLTLTGLHPLREGANTVGSSEGADVRLDGKAPARTGVLEIAGGGIVFRAEPDAKVHVAGDDEKDVETIAMRTDMQDDTTVLAVGTLTFHVIDRGGLLLLRVKDRESATRRDFKGIARFPVDEIWRVTARLAPHDPPRGVTMPNVLGRTSEEPSPGVLIFELAGEICSLTPVGKPDEDLFIVFADATSGAETYGGGRFLSTEAPAADGTVVLDFNKAVIPPCAFTPYATCPLPPAGNTLGVGVRAGEKTWGDH
ncbi:DUF1684 domain-containing protein [bacterium]|nr:DUF1684 domain-containing protein [bacterium]MBU1071703.1 DUF1684 domain-containing protein [bacterium]MBU1676481.1 DUF1684 domain-containing protein [bacterium]